MNEILSDSVFFGFAISVISYWIGTVIRKKWDVPIFNPLLLASIFVIAFLLIFDIDYEVYNNGAKYITFLLTPATVCLAVPLYRQLQVLKHNLPAVLIGLSCGCLAHAGVVLALSKLLNLKKELLLSTLPKSVTTPIALGVSGEIGGVIPVTVAGVMIAGLMGAVIGPLILKLFHIKEPVAQGLAIGAASHAVGTSKALEIGEIQGAMSSLAIVVTGILTVIVVPIVASFV